MGQDVEADALGDNFKGYVFKISGGNDKDGFPMMQGVIVKKRIRLMLEKGHKTYRPRRDGERKRKSVRGCIVGPDICVLALVVVRKGEKNIEGLTDLQVPRRLGPKRANKIRKLFALDKKKDHVSLVKKAAIRRKWKTATGKDRQKAPKIQRLVTDARLRRKRIYKVFIQSFFCTFFFRSSNFWTFFLKIFSFFFFKFNFRPLKKPDGLNLAKPMKNTANWSLIGRNN